MSPTEPDGGWAHTERRLIRMSRSSSGGSGARGSRSAPSDRASDRADEDAVTDRHYPAEWVADSDRGEQDSGGWLLPSSDDDPDDHADGHHDPHGREDGEAVTELMPSGRTAQRQTRDARRRRVVWPAIGAVLLLALVGGAFFARDLIGVFFPADYEGPGTGRVVVRVAEGDSTRAIGEELAREDVVASARAFGAAAEDDPGGRGIQPGYYALQRRMSAAGAVTALLDPAARLGRLDVRSGTQLDDTAGPDGTTVPGVLSLVATAICRPEDADARRCPTASDIRTAMATTDPAELGVPSWALDGVRRADPARRLEGLLAPGTYDLAPGLAPKDALEQVVRQSAPRLEASGLVTEAAAQDVTPYEALVVASLVEREGVGPDFGKVARVIYNRLAVPMRLQFDSTINYPLDRQQLLTTPFDRGRPGSYNSYLNLGLPPTPIAAVSRDALRAALDPTPGPWMYFVKCRTDGESCFAVTEPEHDANRRLAQARGVY